MSFGSQTHRPIAQLKSSSDSRITNKVLASAGTEYSHEFQDGVRKVIIRARNFAALKYSFVATESGTKYETIPALNFKVFEPVNYIGKTIYIQSTLDNTTVEIEEMI